MIRRTTRPSTALAALLGCALAATLGLVAPAPASAAPERDPVPVQLLSFTDFHGQLQPRGRIRDSVGDLIPAGGAAYLATHLAALRHDENSMLFSTGDNYSSWEEEVEGHNDEPTIEFLDYVGMEFTTLGNHEMDVSPAFTAEYMAKGKCYGVIGVDSCFRDSSGTRFDGADFDMYSANIVTEDKEKPLFPGVHVQKFRGEDGGPAVPVAVINLVGPVLDELRNTGGHNLSYYPDLTTLAVAETANALASDLQQRGIEAIVLNVHLGAIHRDGGYDECNTPHGELMDLNAVLSPEIDVVLGGHTHHTLNCTLEDPDGDPRPVVQAAFEGRVISEINLQLDGRSGEVVRDSITSENHAVTRDVEPDPRVVEMAAYWREKLPETRAQEVARIAGDITGERDGSGESSLGNLIADSFLAAARTQDGPSADLAVARTNGPDDHFGADLRHGEDGVVTYGEAWDSMGARDPLLSVEVSGTQLDAMLEAQWRTDGDGTVSFSPLAVSGNVRYSFDASRPVGERVDLASITIDGTPISADSRYRVAALPPTIFSTASRFSDPLLGFTDPARYGVKAREAFRWYLRDHTVVEVPALDRVTVVGAAS
jgi:2',3'-cyclic-nucleotide 2'-phosphodiesterase (5'-nucleotidase family)